MTSRLSTYLLDLIFFFFQAEDGIRDLTVTGVQTCALPISTGFRIHEHEAAVCFNRALHDGESESRAADAAGGEWLEQTFLEIGRDAGTVVAHAERHGVLDAGAAGQLIPRRVSSEDLHCRLRSGGLHRREVEIADDAVQQS